MKTLHNAAMGAMLLAVLAFGAGALHPSTSSAEAQHGEAQHGHVATPADHYAEVATMLELTPEQRETLAAPFDKAFAAMTTLHEQHAVIAAELTGEQEEKLADLMHEMMGMDHGGEHGSHGSGHQH